MKKEYILTSGVLEIYAMGGCSREEAEEIGQWIATDETVNKEYLEIAQALEAYATEQGKQPSPQAWDRIASQLEDKAALPGEHQADSRTRTVRLHTGAHPPPSTETANVRSGVSTAARRRWYLALAASLVIAVGGMAYGYRAQQQWQAAQAQLQRLEQQLAEVQDSLQCVHSVSRERRRALDLVFDPANQMVSLDARKTHAENIKATVCWNTRTHRIHLHAKQLPDAPRGKVYQLWAVVDGKTRDLGVVRPGELQDAPKDMGALDSVQGFLLTLEPKGGSSSPSLTRPYAQGRL
jgi:anti-sigma-K factor RskA